MDFINDRLRHIVHAELSEAHDSFRSFSQTLVASTTIWLNALLNLLTDCLRVRVRGTQLCQ